MNLIDRILYSICVGFSLLCFFVGFYVLFVILMYELPDIIVWLSKTVYYTLIGII